MSSLCTNMWSGALRLCRNGAGGASHCPFLKPTTVKRPFVMQPSLVSTILKREESRAPFSSLPARWSSQAAPESTSHNPTGKRHDNSSRLSQRSVTELLTVRPAATVTMNSASKLSSEENHHLQATPSGTQPPKKKKAKHHRNRIAQRGLGATPSPSNQALPAEIAIPLDGLEVEAENDSGLSTEALTEYEHTSSVSWSKRKGRAWAFSTANSYKIPQLSQYLSTAGILHPFIADDVIHWRPSPASFAAQPTQPVLPASDIHADVYFFEDGTFVTWGASEILHTKLMEGIKPFERSDYLRGDSYSVETEYFDFVLDDSRPSGMSSSMIILGNDLPLSQSKLAFSAGLGRSVKLESLESLLDSFLDKHERIPAYLCRGRKIPIRSSGVLRSLGELFALRGMVNLHSELLEAPDFLWSSAEGERCYRTISNQLDVDRRISIANKKISYASETIDLLRNHLHEQHSIKLEMIIILLIGVEIGFNILHYLEKWEILW